MGGDSTRLWDLIQLQFQQTGYIHLLLNKGIAMELVCENSKVPCSSHGQGMAGHHAFRVQEFYFLRWQYTLSECVALKEQFRFGFYSSLRMSNLSWFASHWQNGRHSKKPRALLRAKFSPNSQMSLSSISRHQCWIPVAKTVQTEWKNRKDRYYQTFVWTRPAPGALR